MYALLKAKVRETKLTREEKIEYALIILLGIALSILLFKFCPAVLAETSTTDAAAKTEMFDAIRTILKVICTIVGGIFLLVGIIKFAISQSNDDGPAQQKAIMMMATGVLLVIIGTVIVDKIKPENWVTT
jgi:hypothetical protein